MYIIDESYFIKELIIPNSSEIDVSGSTDPFEMWIDSKARLCLQLALGNVLFSDLDSNVTTGAYVPGVAKWDNLVNGHTYTKDDKTYKWKGLIYTEGTFKGSLLAYYVYAEWLKFQLTRMSGVGEVKGNAANSVNANSTYRYVETFNTFLEMYQGKSNNDSNLKLSFINGIPFYDYFNGDGSDYVSLITFLKDNETDYPEANLKTYNYLNSFSI